MNLCVLAFLLTLGPTKVMTVDNPTIFLDRLSKDTLNLGYWQRNHIHNVHIIDSAGLPSGKFVHFDNMVLATLNFDHPIDFSFDQFFGEVYFQESQFSEPVNFFGAAFNSRGQRVLFRTAHFKKIADFRSCTFQSGGRFVHNHFDAPALFDNSSFQVGMTPVNSYVDFVVSEFDSIASFNNIRSEVGRNIFSGIKCRQSARFSGSSFAGPVYYAGAVFSTEADFSGASFDSTVAFDRTMFSRSANFRGARFRSNVSFVAAQLPDTLDFSYVSPTGTMIDLTPTRLPVRDRKCHIALFGADLSKFRLDMNSFQLLFPEADHLRLDQQLGLYEMLLKKLRDDGWGDSYQNLDVEYKQFKYVHGGWIGRYFVSPFQQIWWNYGYAPARVFGWTAVMIVVFSSFNLLAYRTLSTRVYRIRFLESKNHITRPARKGLDYVLRVLIYTGFIFFGVKIKDFEDGAASNHPGLFLYVIFMFVSGLFCLGFIINIVFTKLS